MSTHSEGLKVLVGNGASPEVFGDLPLIEVPEFFTSTPSTYPNRTTESTGNTKTYGFGLEDGEEVGLVYEHDFSNTQQDRLRAQKGLDEGVNIQVVISDGSTTETFTANFLVMNNAYQRADPNGDGETDRETTNLKRNSDWTAS